MKFKRILKKLIFVPLVMLLGVGTISSVMPKEEVVFATSSGENDINRSGSFYSVSYDSSLGQGGKVSIVLKGNAADYAGISKDSLVGFGNDVIAAIKSVAMDDVLGELPSNGPLKKLARRVSYGNECATAIAYSLNSANDVDEFIAGGSFQFIAYFTDKFNDNPSADMTAYRNEIYAAIEDAIDELSLAASYVEQAKSAADEAIQAGINGSYAPIETLEDATQNVIKKISLTNANLVASAIDTLNIADDIKQMVSNASSNDSAAIKELFTEVDKDVLIKVINKVTENDPDHGSSFINGVISNIGAGTLIEIANTLNVEDLKAIASGTGISVSTIVDLVSSQISSLNPVELLSMVDHVSIFKRSNEFKVLADSKIQLDAVRSLLAEFTSFADFIEKGIDWDIVIATSLGDINFTLDLSFADATSCDFYRFAQTLDSMVEFNYNKDSKVYTVNFRAQNILNKFADAIPADLKAQYFEVFTGDSTISDIVDYFVEKDFWDYIDELESIDYKKLAGIIVDADALNEMLDTDIFTEELLEKAFNGFASLLNVASKLPLNKITGLLGKFISDTSKVEAVLDAAQNLVARVAARNITFDTVKDFAENGDNSEISDRIESLGDYESKFDKIINAVSKVKDNLPDEILSKTLSEIYVDGGFALDFSEDGLSYDLQAILTGISSTAGQKIYDAIGTLVDEIPNSIKFNAGIFANGLQEITVTIFDGTTCKTITGYALAGTSLDELAKYEGELAGETYKWYDLDGQCELVDGNVEFGVTNYVAVPDVNFEFEFDGDTAASVEFDFDGEDHDLEAILSQEETFGYFTYTYQWEKKNAETGEWEQVAGETSKTLSLNELEDSGTYRLAVYNGVIDEPFVSDEIEVSITIIISGADFDVETIFFDGVTSIVPHPTNLYYTDGTNAKDVDLNVCSINEFKLEKKDGENWTEVGVYTYDDFDDVLESGDYRLTIVSLTNDNYRLADETNIDEAELVIAPYEFNVTETKAAIKTLPVAKEGLVYDCTEQDLFVAGEVATFGNLDLPQGYMLYSFDKTTWTTDPIADDTVLKASDAGTYIIYYKAAGINGYADSDIFQIGVTIDQLALQIDFNDVVGLVYDGTDKLFNYVINSVSFVNDYVGLTDGDYVYKLTKDGDPISGAIDAGNYTFEITSVLNSNYKLPTYDDSDPYSATSFGFVIDQVEILVENRSGGEFIMYNGDVYTGTYQIHNNGGNPFDALVKATELKYYKLDETTSSKIEIDESDCVDAGTYYCEIVSVDNPNYKVSTDFGRRSYEFTIFPRILNIIPDAQSKLVGANDPLTFTYKIKEGDGYNDFTDTHLISLTGNELSREAGEEVGSYKYDFSAIEAAFDGDTNFTVYFDEDTKFEIKIGDIIVTAKPATMVYGAGSFPTFEYDVTDSEGNTVTGISFTGKLTTDAALFDNAGTYRIINSSSSPLKAEGYDITFVEGVFTITPKDLTISWNNTSLEYNGSVQKPTATLTGLISDDSSVKPVYSEVSSKDVGAYSISVTGLSLYGVSYSGNYNLIGEISTTYTITPKALTLSWDSISFVYNGSVQKPTATITGVVDGDNINSTCFFINSINVGEYITSLGDIENPNYYVSGQVSTTYTITPAQVKVTADPQTKTYGDADPELTYTVDVSGFEFVGTLSRVAGENVGTYAISQGTLANANCTIIFVSNSLTISKKTLTVTANDVAITYGDDPVLTYTYSGLVGSDSFTGSLEVNDNNDIVIGTLSAGDNYEINFVKGTLTINKAKASYTTLPIAISNIQNVPGTELVTAGVVDPSSLVIVYSLDGTNFSADLPVIPTGGSATSYTVYYKVEGNDNYDGIAVQTIVVNVPAEKISNLINEVGNVKVNVSEGTLPEGTTISTGTPTSGIPAKLPEIAETEEVVGAYTYDITLSDANGVELDYANGGYEFVVKLLIPEDLKDSDDLRVFYYPDDGGEPQKMCGNESRQVIDGKEYMVFNTTHFSQYIILSFAPKAEANPFDWHWIAMAILLITTILFLVLWLLKKGKAEEQPASANEAPVEEAPAEEPAVEEAEVVQPEVAVVPVPVIIGENDAGEEVVVQEGIKYLYNYSFTARLILTDKERKEYYSIIKNEIMSYKLDGKKGVTDRISWKHELFTFGRDRLVKIKMRRKSLVICLPLDPNDYVDTKYKVEASDAKSNADTPLLYNIKNDRRCKYACDLIAIVMAKYGLTKSEPAEDHDYVTDYPTDTLVNLISRRLVKIKEATDPRFGGTTLEEERKEVEEPVVIAEGENGEEIAIKKDVKYLYNYSFKARLILTDEERKNYYSIIRNEIMSYRLNGKKPVSERLSWKHEVFSFGRDKVCKLKMRRTSLVVCLPLDPNDYVDTKYKVEASDAKSNAETPLLFNIKNDRRCKYACDLIAVVMEKLGLTKVENPETVDYVSENPADTLINLLARKLVKVKEAGEGSFGGKTLAEEAKEAEAEVVAVVEDESGAKMELKSDVRYLYDYSVTARYILTSDERKDYYSTIKNYLLSFKLKKQAIKDRMSWKRETFYLGRNTVAKIKMRRTSLVLCLPLDPNDYADTKYKVEASTSKRDADTPLLYNIKNDRRCTYALQLIDVVMEKLGYTRDEETPAVDYKAEIPGDTLLNLITRKLIKVKQATDGAFGGRTLAEEAKEAEVLTVIVNDNGEKMEVKSDVKYVYDYSISARYVLTDDERKDYYSTIKNFILSFGLKKQFVKARMSWKRETFSLGRNVVAKFKMRRNSLVLCLPLDPRDYADSKYKVESTDSKRDAEIPLMYNIKNDRRCKYALELIEVVMAKLGYTRNENAPTVDYKEEIKADSLVNLITRKLIKLKVADGSIFGGATVAEEAEDAERKDEEK